MVRMPWKSIQVKIVGCVHFFILISHTHSHSLTRPIIWHIDFEERKMYPTMIISISDGLYYAMHFDCRLSPFQLPSSCFYFFYFFRIMYVVPVWLLRLIKRECSKNHLHVLGLAIQCSYQLKWMLTFWHREFIFRSDLKIHPENIWSKHFIAAMRWEDVEYGLIETERTSERMRKKKRKCEMFCRGQNRKPISIDWITIEPLSGKLENQLSALSHDTQTAYNTLYNIHVL